MRAAHKVEPPIEGAMDLRDLGAESEVDADRLSRREAGRPDGGVLAGRRGTIEARSGWATARRRHRRRRAPNVANMHANSCATLSL
jgi:hypothetical protein